MGHQPRTELQAGQLPPARSRYNGRCPEPYTREEVFEDRFSELLRKLTFPKDVMEWLVTALRESHQDEKAFHDEAIGRLQAEYRRLQDRIDAMYVDKLDGRIDNGFFDRKSAEWRTEQDRLLRDVATHQSANRTYIEEGVQLVRLADRAHALVREAGTGGKTAPPQFSTFELRLEGRFVDRGIPPTI
jgi:hypothetical protein